MKDIKEKFLKDYKKPAFLIDKINLTIDLDDHRTSVTSVMRVKKNDMDAENNLFLHGENLELHKLFINDEQLNTPKYVFEDENLLIKDVPRNFELKIINNINPKENKALEGLYKSGGIFCTQNEPEGFRRITYYIDRPDNMAIFTTKIIGEKDKYPVMLSNGNLTDSGDLPNGKHYKVWHDPFKKPSYLYALVAGDFGMVEDKYLTGSNKEVILQIYCDKGNEDKCHFAMKSLKMAMRWDEDVYGLEYDLDIFMIVAVDSFNMGAMENKGLNIFNSALVLADSKTATDFQFQSIEAVVGHEYFHNFTGNRITCRDWFQLTLKEGLTVFRDQEFSSDMNIRSVQRIEDVESIKESQFPEDAGPTSHPIRPSSYIEINNFYTSTVYEKGAEIIRMIHTMLGADGFKKGMDKYFELYDGQAITTEEFVYAMSVSNLNYDFKQFEKSWYTQAGTPKLAIKTDYLSSKREFHLYITQLLKDGQTAFHIPFRIGLVDKNGDDMNISLKEERKKSGPSSDVLHIKESEEKFIFTNVEHKPVISLNREFSAPVNIEYDRSFTEKAFLLSSDNDTYARYEMACNLSIDMIMKILETGKKEISAEYITAWGNLLRDRAIDYSFKALSISMPSEKSIHQKIDVVDYRAVHNAIKYLKRTLAKHFKDDLKFLYEELVSGSSYEYNSREIGRRNLKSKVLGFLMTLNDESIHKMVFHEFNNATNMTEEYAAFCLLTYFENEFRGIVKTKFYQKWKENQLVLMKWMAAISSSSLSDTLQQIQQIIISSDFDKTVPNIIRSIQGSFSRNYIHFHKEDGSGYRFTADWAMKIDEYNPSISSALCKTFSDYNKVMPENKILMKRELLRIGDTKDLSKNAAEIIGKILK